MGNIHLGKARNCSNMRGGVFKSPLYLSIREIVCQEEQIIIGKGIHYSERTASGIRLPDFRVGPNIS